jgi:hypothetical protein
VVEGAENTPFCEEAAEKECLANNVEQEETEITITATFSQTPPPAITGLNPNKGLVTGGNQVTITGTNLSDATEVKFGAAVVEEEEIIENTATTIKVAAPAHAAGTVDVRVVSATGESANTPADNYTYLEPPPSVTGVSPDHGPTAGEQVVTITGTDLANATQIKFGATSVLSNRITTNTATEIVLRTPAHPAGQVDVTVTTAGGTSAIGPADRYTYEGAAPPTHTLTISMSGTGSGTVSCDGGACQSSYIAGETVMLAATPAPGSTFGGWSGGCSGTAVCAVTLNADTVVGASFLANQTPPPPPPPVPGTPKFGSTASYRGGKALLTVTCEGNGPCSGTVKLSAKLKIGKKLKTVTIGKETSYSVDAGGVATVAVKIVNGQAKKVLNQGKTISAKLLGEGLKGSVRIKAG